MVRCIDGDDTMAAPGEVSADSSFSTTDLEGAISGMRDEVEEVR
jgi:hypothetical protein